MDPEAATIVAPRGARNQEFMMIRIDRTKIGGIWRDHAFQMAIGYVVLAVTFAIIATSESQFKYLFLMVPGALFLAGVMTWMFVHNTNMIIIYDDEKTTAWRPNRAPQEDNQTLAWRTEDIIAGLGLTQMDFSIAGGRITRSPQVVSVAAGPPVGLHIRTLPGQTPDDFAARASAIAYNLDVAQVRVVPLGPSLIRLDLMPRTSHEVSKAA
jgi:hypothetical protein